MLPFSRGRGTLCMCDICVYVYACSHAHICITCVHVCVYTYVYGCMHVQLNYGWIILILCCFLLFAPELLMLEDPTAQFLDLFSALFMHSSLVIAFSLMNLNTIHMLTAPKFITQL